MLSGRLVRIWRAGNSQFQTALTSFPVPGPHLQVSSPLASEDIKGPRCGYVGL